MKHQILRGILVSASALAVAVGSPAMPAWAQVGQTQYDFNIPAQDLAGALNMFARVSQRQITFASGAVAGKASAGLKGRFSADEGLGRLLANSGLSFTVGQTGVFIVREAAPAPQGPPVGMAAQQDMGAGTDIIVTAQKKAESIQSVPIAITAITSKALDDKKIEGGADLLRAVPNMNFTKTFSSMYNITIRGIGTKALNSSSDPGVAVAYNNTPLIRNRLFEQEFFDLERVEVLRGPQGTLYGRNATGGVVNMIPALPTDEFEGTLKGETGNYKTRRISGMVNVPLGDNFAIRAAGAWTKRDGFDFNEFTGRRVNGRDLWSTRVSAQWEPSDKVRFSAIWEHFNENDDRSRSGKALCTTDTGPTMVGSTEVPDNLRGRLSQGCLPKSLYDDAAYGFPLANTNTAYYVAALLVNLGLDPNTGQLVPAVKPGDPFAGLKQSRDPRRLSMVTDPTFRAKNDIFQFNGDFEIADGLKFVSQTAYSRDRWYSSQNYDRFATNPIFNDSRGLVSLGDFSSIYTNGGQTTGGVYVDAQLGPSDRVVSVDVNRTRTRQWTQEFRIQSDWKGPVNFNIGVNYLDFKTRDNYYAFSNLFNLVADSVYLYDRDKHNANPLIYPVLSCKPGSVPSCLYKDTSSINDVDNLGHNYFLSQNNVRTKSLGLFGELYWKPADDLKLTFGVRYTRDRKIQSQIPTQLLLSSDPLTGGKVDSGYPPLDDIRQKWGEFTGRVVVDWKPQVRFTDDTLIYFSASRGYKAGGANPPRVDFSEKLVTYLPLPNTYKPEFVNAFEIGTKNTLMNGKLTLNATAFFYDYKNYQVSQVTDRITFTENFPAQTWGVELETQWRPTRAFRVDASAGYLRTKLKKGAQSIDPMDRTAGNPDWQVVRPWLQSPANCIAPKRLVEKILNSPFAGFLGDQALAVLCGGTGINTFDPSIDQPTFLKFYDLFGFTYNNIKDAPNGGRGFSADLSGNELPNAPRFTVNVGAQYTLFIDSGDWELTFRGDYYRQSKTYARVFNTEIDRLKSWQNVNLSVTLARPTDDLAFQFYVKNVFNSQPITDVFLSADDIGLPANTFYTDPRIIGFNVSKKF